MGFRLVPGAIAMSCDLSVNKLALQILGMMPFFAQN
jgi:hypothetical protein